MRDRRCNSSCPLGSCIERPNPKRKIFFGGPSERLSTEKEREFLNNAKEEAIKNGDFKQRIINILKNNGFQAGARVGWLSPNAKFYYCGYPESFELFAEFVLDSTEQELLNQGWLKICYNRYVNEHHVPTETQNVWLSIKDITKQTGKIIYLQNVA